MSSSSFSVTSYALAEGLGRTQEFLGRSISRLGSGNRILRPSDDPAGVGVTSKFESQTRRIGAAATNVQNAISHVQTADGMLAKMGSALTRLSELATRARDPIQSAGDVALYEEEFKALLQQVRDTVGGTTAQIGGTVDVSDPIGVFNGRQLFGTDGGMDLHVGANADEVVNIAPNNLRVGSVASVITQDASGNFLLSVLDPNAVSALESALDAISAERAKVGAVQSRLEILGQTLTVEGENLGAALSRIRDVDVASETTQMTKLKLLNETGTAMLSQANQSPKSVLRLLEE